MKHSPEKYANFIKQKAASLGFDFCGIAHARFLEEEAPRLEQWLNQNMHGQMHYMANHFEKRLDPTQLVPGAKSVISLMYNYYPEKKLDETSESALKLAKYAYGTDYHFVIKDLLKSLFQAIQEEIGQVEGRVFVDSAPVMERQWAALAGLGWQGKNSLLLNKQMGSFFFLAEIICDLSLPPDGPVKDYCGTCTRCIDACPTDAIPEPYVVDGSRCISYLTIELKDAIPNQFKEQMEGWVFGCDICQDVCPWNRFSKPHKQPAFDPSAELEGWGRKDWQEMTEETFRRVFKKSAVKRTGYKGLKRNVDFSG
jgi:epoxyqueuosine reductase